MSKKYTSFLTASKNFIDNLCDYIVENEEKSSKTSMRAISYKKGYRQGINHVSWSKISEIILEQEDLETLIDIESYKRGYKEGKSAAILLISILDSHTC